ncbi:MAG: hypothetical protein GX304_02235 [Clostridiales bacterium]|jgi:stage IV sporulation protein FB|nr:hypothetical protein [Clostridiales bacterium]
MRFKFHPLFLIFGVILTLLGNGYLFLVYMFTATVHELAHALAAMYFKCRPEEIVLYPYGAVLYGEFSSLKPYQEAVVALCGPLLNLFTAVVFTALWWLFPELYVYTDTVVMVNVSIAAFNLLPAYPLDGGRILLALLRPKIGPKRAFKAVKALGVICLLAFLALYFYSFVIEANYTFAVVAIFLLSSLLDGDAHREIERVIYPPSGKFLMKGVEKKTLRVSASLSLLKMMRLLDVDSYYVIEVIGEGGKKLFSFEHSEFERVFLKNPPQTLLKDISR